MGSPGFIPNGLGGESDWHAATVARATYGFEALDQSVAQGTSGEVLLLGDSFGGEDEVDPSSERFLDGEAENGLGGRAPRDDSFLSVDHDCVAVDWGRGCSSGGGCRVSSCGSRTSDSATHLTLPFESRTGMERTR